HAPVHHIAGGVLVVEDVLPCHGLAGRRLRMSRETGPESSKRESRSGRKTAGVDAAEGESALHGVSPKLLLSEANKRRLAGTNQKLYSSVHSPFVGTPA